MRWGSVRSERLERVKTAPAPAKLTQAKMPPGSSLDVRGFFCESPGPIAVQTPIPSGNLRTGLTLPHGGRDKKGPVLTSYSSAAP